MFGRADEAAGEVPGIADDRGIAGQQCERSYNALTRNAESDQP
ncbi:DUF2514 domain-containing protein [Burkholderia multivorans]|nr:DUF2514 domain-containing protein [Burkholderia multivorans]